MVDIIHSEIQRENNESLKELILKEIETRNQWLNEIRGIVGKTAKIIAVGVTVKKSVYASLGGEINLFVPSLNGYICWDKFPVDEDDYSPVMSEDEGVYATAVKDGVKYVFMKALLNDGVIDRKLVSSYGFMGAIAEIYSYEDLWDDLKTRANGKIPELPDNMKQFIDNFNYSSTAVKLQTLALKDENTPIEEKEDYLRQITQQILISAKSVEGLGGKKPKNYDVAVLLYVRNKFGMI